MELGVGDKILAEDFIALKASIKEEMARRCHSGSLKAYSEEAYDFTVIPEKDEVILASQMNKLAEPVNAIAPTGISHSQEPGELIRALSDFEQKLAAHKVYPMRGSGTDCESSCSGLCSSGCWNSCSGCGSSCSTGCSGCSGTCSGECEGCGSGCASGCEGYCTGTCYGSCHVACATAAD